MITPTKQKKLGYNSMGFNIAAMGLFSLGIGLRAKFTQIIIIFCLVFTTYHTV